MRKVSRQIGPRELAGLSGGAGAEPALEWWSSWQGRFKLPNSVSG